MRSASLQKNHIQLVYQNVIHSNKTVTRKISLLGILISATCLASSAGSNSNSGDQSRNASVNAKLLNFQDDFVRGRSLSPDMLLQMAQAPRSLDSVIYFRKDFNDFHQLDLKSRPQFFAP